MEVQEALNRLKRQRELLVKERSNEVEMLKEVKDRGWMQGIRNFIKRLDDRIEVIDYVLCLLEE